MSKLAKLMCVSVTIAVTSMLCAVEVTPVQARTAVKNWIRKNPCPMMARFSSGDGEPQTFTKDGTTLFHVVQLDNGGFVVTSGDTRISPIVAFSDGGTFVPDVRNPLHALLVRDINDRIVAVTDDGNLNTKSGSLAARASSEKESLAEYEWNELLREEASGGVRSKSGVLESEMSDIRVAPLIKSHWSQSTWGDRTSKNVYNYFTPNHYVCGCVATAGAQVMRYFRWPTAEVVARSYQCVVGNEQRTLKMYGGTYDWDNMPLSYEETPNITETQQKAIGKLTYDIGVASEMTYTSAGSGTGELPFADNLRTVFGYASAMLFRNFDLSYNKNISSNEQLQNAVLASIDAGCPVTAGIYGDPINGGRVAGHFIVLDGYGYYGNAQYIHINFGWSGEGDLRGGANVWYNVFGEKPSANGHLWRTMACVCYNIHPSEVGDVISGRVLDTAGKPAAGATVTLSGDGMSPITKKSGANGIWYFRVTKPMSYNVTASSGTRTSKNTTVRVQQSSTGTVYTSGVVGNKWGVDLTLESESEVISVDPVVYKVAAPVFSPAEGTFTTSSSSITLSCGTSGATIYYTINGSTPTTSSTRYTGAVTISSTTTFKAIAVKSGMTNSDVVSKTYTKVQIKPTISLNSAIDDNSHSYTVSDSSMIEGQDGMTHDGVDALKVACSKTTETTITTAMSGPGTLSFWWCDPSATKQTALDGSWTNYVSYFSCSVTKSDGTAVSSKTCGGINWEKCEIPLPSGSYTVTWRIRYGWPSAARTAYLDEVSFTTYSGGTRKVLFYANGADGGALAQSSMSVAFACNVTLPDCGTLYKDGYRFVGWSKSSSARQAEFESGDIVQVGAQDITFYAVWKKILPVLVEIPQSGGDAVESLSLYGNSYTAYIAFPAWASYFKMTGVSSSGGTVSLNLSNGRSRLSISGNLSLQFSAGVNDTAEDRSFDLDMDAKNYPYVIRYHVVQKADVASSKPKQLIIEQDKATPFAAWVTMSGGTAEEFVSRIICRNGTMRDVQANWSIASGGAYASISDGVLKTKDVDSTKTVVICATYSEAGVLYTCEREITVEPKGVIPSVVTFNSNGGKFSNGAATKTVTAMSGNLWGKMPMPSLSGQVFDGWYTAAEGGDIVTASSEVPVADTIYYAHWTPRLGLAAASEWSGAFDTDSWCGQGTVSHDGRDALRSGIIYDGQNSYLITRVAGSGVLTFWWAVSCEGGGKDALRFLVDGEQKELISGEVGWTKVEVYIRGAGTHVLKWNYTKNGSVTKGEDFGWVDQIEWSGSDVDAFYFDANGGKFSNGATVKKTDAQEGNLWGKMYMPARDGYVFTGWYTAKEGGNLVTSSDAVPFYYTTYYARWTPRLGLAAASEWGREFTTDSWCGQGAVSHDGKDALRSGIVYDGQSSYLLTRVLGPGTLTFWWKVSCEGGGNDALRLLVDGSQVQMISGETDWTKVTMSINGSGTHVIKWNYTKNGSVTKGQDFGWIDQIGWQAK